MAMNAKSYLQQVKLCDANINNKLAELAQLEDMLKKVTSTLKPVAVKESHAVQDKAAEAVSRIVDLKNELNADIDRYVDLKLDIEDMIKQIPDINQMDVLYKRYILYEGWEQIAWEIGYTYRNTCYIHGKALQAFAGLMKSKGVENG